MLPVPFTRPTTAGVLKSSMTAPADRRQFPTQLGAPWGCCFEAFDRLLHYGPDLSVRAKCHVEGEIREVTPLGYARARQQWGSEADGTLGHEQRLVYREIDRLREIAAPE